MLFHSFLARRVFDGKLALSLIGDPPKVITVSLMHIFRIISLCFTVEILTSICYGYGQDSKMVEKEEAYCCTPGEETLRKKWR